ncbi:hypothetical protein [Acetobacterium woodii]|uniref:Uncharacterized protein n=1 Tax=Acetobacterium woodii (strain ATCC 29683 / DSM 1030 / JCM 2381 / KCTC 1655 / WB1) TaxID=931626 RepID=H6LDD2_ACEWD|nr:hypothetical protein [Acetobacterium woodii]AFA47904.1 hypothetical protein Awo_c11200 [Acetobacterium woodii DSM 1030]
MKTEKKGRAINTIFNRNKKSDLIDSNTDSDKYESENEKFIQNEEVKNEVEMKHEIDQSEQTACEEMEVFDPEQENEDPMEVAEDTQKDEKAEHEANDELKNKDASEQDEKTGISKSSHEADPDEITTVMKEIDRLNQVVEDLKSENAEISIERDQNEKLYLELKDILVHIGLTKELDILENIKTKLKSEQERRQFLEKSLKEKEVFIESLKNGIFSGINQLFDQKPPNQIVGKPENTAQIEVIEASHGDEDVRNIKSSNEIAVEIMELNKSGKNLAEIAKITKLPKQKVSEFLRKHGNVDEEGA